MKKNKLIISLLVGSLALGACDLDETAYGFYSEDNFSRRLPMRKQQYCMLTVHSIL